MEYHVEYRIEVEADSPRAAAEQVAALLAGGGAERGVYHVREHDAGGPGRERAEVVIDLDERTCAECGDTAHTLSTDDLCDGCVEEQEHNATPRKTADELRPGDVFRHGMMRPEHWVTVRRLWRYTSRRGLLAHVPMITVSTVESPHNPIRMSRKTTVYLKEN